MRRNYTGVKKRIGRAVCIAAAAVTVMMCGCADAGDEEYTAGVKVSVADSVFFTARDGSAEAEYGEDCTFVLDMRPGYVPVSCDYPDYEIEQTAVGEYRLTLKNIKRPSRVSVVSEETEVPVNTNPERECVIEYDLNDGSGKVQREEYTLSYHIRPNTLGGADIFREGYTLIGWNTERDGSGEHIGLGSRVTVADGATLTLYGEWVQWLPDEDFSYRILDDGTAALSSYRGKGDVECFAVPGEMAGVPVSTISSSFTTNILCGSIESETLVLPASVTRINGSAFNNASFDRIYFFDSLQSVGRGAFSKNISTYHVNAVAAPRLQKSNYNVRFADNLDLIIANKDRPKLILFSGCSLCYGMNSGLLEGSLGGEYAVVNAGLNGEFNALFQMECMLPYINEGDVFVHAPEQMNQYQFLESLRVDGRVFAMVEGNYDLLALADFSYSSTMFDAWEMYCGLRESEDEGSYDDHTGMFNNYGDYVEPRPYDESTEAARDVSYTENCGYYMSLLTEENIAALADIYGKFEERGAKVYFSWAPMNEQSNGNADIYAAAKEFQARLEELFEPYGYEIISEVTDYIWKGRYFYDTDYHLNDLGTVLRTEQLANDLKACKRRC